MIDKRNDKNVKNNCAFLTDFELLSKGVPLFTASQLYTY